MSVSISDTKKGYVEFLTFLNNELASPTFGGHEDFINEVPSILAVKDLYVGICELYDTPTNYVGCLVVQLTDTPRIFFLQNNIPVARTQTESEIAKLFTIQDNTIKGILNDSIEMYLNADTKVISHLLEVSGAIFYGNTNYYAHVRENGAGDTPIVASSLLTSKTFATQSTAFYRVKIDSDILTYITMTGARNSKTQFSVEVANGNFESFEYSEIGEVMQVQRTSTSEASVAKLIRQGIVNSDI